MTQLFERTALARADAVATRTCAFVTDSVPDRDCVLVVDPGTGATLATVAVGGHPTAVAVSAERQRAYVSTFESGSVSVVDTGSYRVVDTIALPLTGSYSAAADLTLSPDGASLYVVDWGQNLLFVIDVATHAILASVEVGANPDAVVATAARVYVANEADDTVSVVDATSYAVTRTIRVGRGPTGLALVPAAGLLYVAANADGVVTVIDTVTQAVLATLSAAGAYQVAASLGGSRVYVSVDAGILVIDSVRTAVVAMIDIPANSFADVSVGPDGRIYDGHDGPGRNTATLDAFDPDTFERTSTTSFPGVLNSVTVAGIPVTSRMRRAHSRGTPE
jgi:YVTN family beta-propeller protein